MVRIAYGIYATPPHTYYYAASRQQHAFTPRFTTPRAPCAIETPVDLTGTHASRPHKTLNCPLRDFLKFRSRNLIFPGVQISQNRSMSKSDPPEKKFPHYLKRKTPLLCPCHCSLFRRGVETVARTLRTLFLGVFSCLLRCVEPGHRIGDCLPQLGASLGLLAHTYQMAPTSLSTK